jgi:hypothetical protein
MAEAAEKSFLDRELEETERLRDELHELSSVPPGERDRLWADRLLEVSARGRMIERDLLRKRHKLADALRDIENGVIRWPA